MKKLILIFLSVIFILQSCGQGVTDTTPPDLIISDTDEPTVTEPSDTETTDTKNNETEESKLTNKTGAGWTVRTQADRGKFYQNYALMLLECKGCVGFDWFKYWDNDPDDKNADLSNIDSNKGIYANDYSEYTDLTDYMQELNLQKYNLIEFFDER